MCQSGGLESVRGRTAAVRELAAFSPTLVNSSALSESSRDTPRSRARSSSRVSVPYCDLQNSTPGFISTAFKAVNRFTQSLKYLIQMNLYSFLNKKPFFFFFSSSQKYFHL